jgi:hypothetical protein
MLQKSERCRKLVKKLQEKGKGGNVGRARPSHVYVSAVTSFLTFFFKKKLLADSFNFTPNVTLVVLTSPQFIVSYLPALQNLQLKIQETASF